MNPTYDFKGRVALVTGASSGMGLATSKAFAEAGAAVVLVDRNGDALDAATRELASAGHEAIGVVCDVADEAQGRHGRARRRRVRPAGHGLQQRRHPRSDVRRWSRRPAEGFDGVNAVNLRGVWTFMKHELIQMREARQRRDRQLLVARRPRRPARPGGLPRDQARRDRPDQERGARRGRGRRPRQRVCPGVIDTPMGGEIDPDAMKEFLKRPADRSAWARPEEIAAAVLWLCSPGASFVLGVALPVDGGFTAH